MLGWCQPKHRTDCLRVPEASWHVDGGAIGQRDHGADTGGCHQAPANIIVPDDGQQAAVQDPTCSRSTRRTMSSGSTSTAKSGRFSTSSLMRASNLTVPTMPTLRPKLRKVARRSFSMAMALD